MSVGPEYWLLFFTFIIIMPCISDYVIVMHNWVTFAVDKMINNFLWLLLLIIHLCEVENGLYVLGHITMIGSYQCYHMAERSEQLPSMCLGLDSTLKEAGFLFMELYYGIEIDGHIYYI